MPGTVSPFPGRSSRGVFCRRRLIGLSRRGIALAVLASLFVYLIACTMAAVGLPGRASDAVEAPAHHIHPESAPEQAECCGFLQDASMSARQKNLLPSLFGVTAPFFLICCFRLGPSVRPGAARPPADPPGPAGHPRLGSALQPRAPPR